MKTLIKIAFLALILILGYNYFMGDEKEKEQAEQIVDKVKALGSDIKGLVVSEKEKYDEGKYDNAINKFSELITSLKDKISSIDYNQLEDKKSEIENSLEKLKESNGELNADEKGKLTEEMEGLFLELQQAIEKIDNNK